MENVTEVVEIVLQYATMWGPSIVAIIGVVVSVVTALSKLSSAVENFKQDKTIDNLRAEMEQIKHELHEENRQTALMLDEVSKIKGYSETKKKEGK